MCCARGCVGVGAQHCPLGLHALWGLRAAGVVGGRPRGGWPATVVRGVWCQVLSLPRPPVLWSRQLGLRDPCVPGAVRAGVGTQPRPQSLRPCGPALLAVGVAEGRPRGGAFRRCEGHLWSGAPPPPTARPLGVLLGSVTHMPGGAAVWVWGPNDPPVKKTREHSAAKLLWPNRDATTRVRLVPVISLMMNSQESLATGFTAHELFMGRPAWFLHAPHPEDSYSTVGKFVKEQQDKVDKAKAMLQRVRERQWNKKSKHRVPASYQEGDWVLVHHSRLPAWPRSTSDDPYFQPYKILSLDGHRITVLCFS